MTRTHHPVRCIGLAATLALSATAAPPLAGQDTLRLAALHDAALRRDPRARQLDLLAAQTALRLETLAAERLPQLSVTGEAMHQSDVTSLSVPLAAGARPPQPPKDRWQGQLGAQQLVYDGGAIAGRRAVERARLAESREGVRVAQHRLRSEVNAAFFSAFLLRERGTELAALIEDLRARLGVARARVREGTALPGDTASLGAELLRAEQSLAEVAADRGAAYAVLGRLVGDTLADTDVLALPDLAAPVARAMAAGAAAPAGSAAVARARPEFAQFARARDRIGREAALADIARRPHVYAFGQAGYGRPGLDQFRDRPDEFWTAGVRLEWQPWSWGTTSRQEEALRLQQRIVEAEEAAFAEGLERAVQDDLAAIARLRSAIESDDRIIALREQVERQARAQLDEGAITAADYVEARTDVLDARLARQRHRAELAQARAGYLTTLGIEPR